MTQKSNIHCSNIRCLNLIVDGKLLVRHPKTNQLIGLTELMEEVLKKSNDKNERIVLMNDDSYTLPPPPPYEEPKQKNRKRKTCGD